MARTLFIMLSIVGVPTVLVDALKRHKLSSHEAAIRADHGEGHVGHLGPEDATEEENQDFKNFFGDPGDADPTQIMMKGESDESNSGSTAKSGSVDEGFLFGTANADDVQRAAVDQDFLFDTIDEGETE